MDSSRQGAEPSDLRPSCSIPGTHSRTYNRLAGSQINGCRFLLLIAHLEASKHAPTTCGNLEAPIPRVVN